MPPQAPSTPEVSSFLANLLMATREGVVQWKELTRTAFTAPLDNGYTVRIEEVPDFDEGTWSEDTSPDHIVTLFRGDDALFEVDRRVVESEELSRALGEQVEFTYRFFLELWRSAQLKATNVADHLHVINRALNAKIRQRREEAE